MKKLLLLFLLPFLIAATYYVDTTGGLDTNNGTTTGSAWKTFDKVFSLNYTVGDIEVSFKRGEVFPVSINKYVTLTNCNNITFNSYGTGDKPKIQELTDIHGTGGWEDGGGNVWHKHVWCRSRVVLSGIEYFPSKTDETGITVERRFYIDTTASPSILYIYSTQDPDLEYSSIKVLQSSYIFRIINSTNITIDGLDLIGGMTGCVYITRNSNNIDLINNKVSYWGTHGIELYGYVDNNMDKVSNVTISNNLITSMMNATYPTDGYSSDDLLVQDGINLRHAVSDCLISNNTFDGNPHCSVTLEAWGTTDYYGVKNNIVENNTIKNDINCAYSRGLGCGGKDGYVTGNIIRNNYITKQNISSQFGGNNNFIYNNIWTNGTTSPRLADRSQHVKLNAYGGTYAITCHDNLFAHNVLDNSYLIGLELWGQSGYENYNNTIANNIFLNSNSTGNNVQIREYNQPYTHDNIIKNNIIYSSASNNTVIFNATTYTVAEAESLDEFSSNIASDPLLSSRYRLLPGSPAINSGATELNVTTDYLGNTRIGTPDIGAMEAGNFLTANNTLRNCTLN